MVYTQLELSEEQNEVVRVYMAKNKLSDKRVAIGRIIEDYDYLSKKV